MLKLDFQNNETTVKKNNNKSILVLFFLNSHFHFVNNRVTRTFTTTRESFGTFRTHTVEDFASKFWFYVLPQWVSLPVKKSKTVYPVADHFVLLSVTGCFFLFLGK